MGTCQPCVSQSLPEKPQQSRNACAIKEFAADKPNALESDRISNSVSLRRSQRGPFQNRRENALPVLTGYYSPYWCRQDTEAYATSLPSSVAAHRQATKRAILHQNPTLTRKKWQTSPYFTSQAAAADVIFRYAFFIYLTLLTYSSIK